eukprot:TRINITY_DN75912_c0_g1_i1.p1 TRINITY_DN75912_c0_g1~~TRINITY_DN75912_c0_g1_i1.p1  ORF type:complete len:491 (-),score=76.21 TRINITY_DN75912_c0_g1_i1:128-1600(-)
MSLQENIRYVREKKIAGLLNEMVLHILSKTPDEPLDELIEFLEKRRDKSGKGRLPTTGAASGGSSAGTGGSAPAAEEAVAAPLPIPVAQANLSATAPTPRFATYPQGMYKSPRRSEPVEEPAQKFEDDPSLDYDPKQADRTLAEMFTNEVILRNALNKQEQVPPVRRAIQTSRNTKRLIGHSMVLSKQVEVYPQMKELGISDPDDFMNFAVLMSISKLIKNEAKFHKKLTAAENEVPRDGLKYFLHAKSNSEQMLTDLYKLEGNAVKTEMRHEGGMAGRGVLTFLNLVASTTVKQIKVLERHQDHMLRKIAPRKAHKPPEEPAVALCQQFMYNEHKFHRILSKAKDEAHGSKLALSLIAKARRNSDKLTDLMKDCALNYFYIHDGRAPANHDQLVAELQKTKEDIRTTAAQLVSTSNRVTATVYTGAIAGVATKLKESEDKCKATLDDEAEKAWAVPDLEAARERSGNIQSLLEKIQQNQRMIQRLAASK